MAELNLGVIDIPYSSTEGEKQAVTTGDVAEILEGKYHLFTAFYAAHEGDIHNAMLNSLEGAMEGLFMGAPIGDPLAGAAQDITDKFKSFLANAEIESMNIDGVPTKAALEGKSLRFKRKKGARRPSFIDTGTLEASLIAWVDK
jgi:hypothetical protein